MIEIIRDEEEIERIKVGGEDLDTSEDGERWIAPRQLLKNVRVSELPVGVLFEVCEQVETGIIIVGDVPLLLERTEGTEVRATIEDMGRRKYWDGKFAFGLLMETKRAVIEDRAREIGDVRLESYDYGGARSQPRLLRQPEWRARHQNQREADKSLVKRHTSISRTGSLCYGVAL